MTAQIGVDVFNNYYNSINYNLRVSTYVYLQATDDEAPTSTWNVLVENFPKKIAKNLFFWEFIFINLYFLYSNILSNGQNSTKFTRNPEQYVQNSSEKISKNIPTFLWEFIFKYPFSCSKFNQIYSKSWIIYSKFKPSISVRCTDRSRGLIFDSRSTPTLKTAVYRPGDDVGLGSEGRGCGDWTSVTSSARIGVGVVSVVLIGILNEAFVRLPLFPARD